jgi:predicted flavoprotein YhiN
VMLQHGRPHPDHIVIIGAGAAGLMAARELDRGQESARTHQLHEPIRAIRIAVESPRCANFGNRVE